MHKRSQQDIREHLRQSDVQARIWKDIQDARSKATVTISRAASLFGFSESQLREWEKRGLLQTERSSLSQDGKSASGHRQYSPAELDKLAIIRELIDQGYAPGDIPLDINTLWLEVAPRQETGLAEPGMTPRQADRLPIDRYVEAMDQQEFWRYFVAQALRISLALICEHMPDTLAGLILPLEDRQLAAEIQAPADLPRLGPSLVGWVGANRSFYTFLDPAPAFEFSSDFRLETLLPAQSQGASEDRVLENVVIAVQRRARPLSLAPELVETVRRILNLVYKHQDMWQPCFGYSMRDWLYQAPDLERASNITGDLILNSLLELVIELGGQTSDGLDCWHFCALLLPGDASLPIQQQSLVVRAQTHRSPYEIGRSVVNPKQTDSLSLKAFQSGQLISFEETLPGESMTTYQLPTALRNSLDVSATPVLEVATRSALAIPIMGEHGIAAAVLYVASAQPQAFPLDQQRALRVMSRMVEEQLLTAQARRQVSGKLGDLVMTPAVVDPTFHDFASETDFIVKVEQFLHNIQQSPAQTPQSLAESEQAESLHILAVDIDNQSRIALKYGNIVAKNLSHEVGIRMRGQMRMSEKYAAGKIFHISADRYYFLLQRVSFEEVCNLARQLREILQETYRISSSDAVTGRPTLPENMLEVAGVTTHLGVSTYSSQKCADLLFRYPEYIAVKRVRALVMAALEEILERGKSAGGDTILIWDDIARKYKPLL